MTKLFPKFLFLLIFFLSACRIAPMGYVDVNPFAKPLSQKIDKTLYILLDDGVQDRFSVEGEGIKSMQVHSFRLSTAAGLKKVFEKNFTDVQVIDQPRQEGLVYTLYRLRPYWSLSGAAANRRTNSEGGTYTSTTSYISAAFQFESSLFLDGKKIADGDGRDFSDGQMSKINQAHNVFQNGFNNTMETINKLILTDEVIDQITKR